MTVLGIDLAAGAPKTCACILDARNGSLHAHLEAKCDDQRLFDLAADHEKVAIDAPFGWPSEFVDALNAHRAASGWPAPDDEAPELVRAALSFRATDRIVMQTRRPLSVSTDKLGVTAMRCAFLLDRWSRQEPVDRTGRGRFVEVYPAGALVRWGLAGSGYKSSKDSALSALLRSLLGLLPSLELAPEDRALCATNDDAFDALVAALVGRAAQLGLTDPPPDTRVEQAEEEGWIHLPVRGSLPFLAQQRASLTAKPARSLGDALEALGRSLTQEGYVSRPDEILLDTFSPATKERIEADLSGKGGSELVPRGVRLPKFQAAHSSAALAANAFGPFLVERTELPLAGQTFTGETHLEVECPSGLGGTPPTLDCLVRGEHILAVESKCIETFAIHQAKFSDTYAAVITHAHATWRAEYQRLLEDPLRYRYLDAAQLIKHYLGLRKTFPDRPVTFAYLFWTPTNSSEIAVASIHAAEVAEFGRVVRDPKVGFVGMSYREVWDDWGSRTRPTWLREHVHALRKRYDVSI